MGRREENAERTRSKILKAARALFDEHGFADTSMESIAGAAGVGATTLYRYFPTKDSLLLGFLGSSIRLLATEVAAAAPDEDLASALGRGVAAVLAVEDRAGEQTLRLRALIDESPAARAALWDEITREEGRLTQVIAARTGEAHPAYVAMATARVAISVIQIAADAWRAEASGPSSSAIAFDVLRSLNATGIVMPAMADPKVTRA